MRNSCACIIALCHSVSWVTSKILEMLCHQRGSMYLFIYMRASFLRLGIVHGARPPFLQ